MELHLLDRTQTLAARHREFKKFCKRLAKCMSEGIVLGFETFSVMVGNCVNEDASLSHILNSPGMEEVSFLSTFIHPVSHPQNGQFLSARLQLTNNQLIGLTKTQA